MYKIFIEIPNAGSFWLSQSPRVSLAKIASRVDKECMVGLLCINSRRSVQYVFECRTNNQVHVISAYRSCACEGMQIELLTTATPHFGCWYFIQRQLQPRLLDTGLDGSDGTWHGKHETWSNCLPLHL
jgi:hypothetical protein